MVVSVTRLVVVNLLLTEIGLIACFILVQDVPLSVVEKLGPTNRISYGVWGRPEFCAEGAYAVGYELKIEPMQGSGDDTALNAIDLYCQFLDGGGFGGTASSKEGLFGTWRGRGKCPDDTFLVEFALQVEEDQHGGDDTSANYIKFRCRRFDGTGSKTELASPPGSGYWGVMGSWSRECPPNTAICGIQTRVEDDQHGGDDTSLNDVLFYCCKAK